MTDEAQEVAVKDQLEELFFSLLTDAPDDELFDPAQIPAGADELALAYLRARHVDGVPPDRGWERTPALASILAAVLGRAGGVAARRLLAIALDAGRPAQLRALGELLRAALSPDELAAALVDAAAGSTLASTRINARELVYHTFDAGGDEYEASPELRARLAGALADPS